MDKLKNLPITILILLISVFLYNTVNAQYSVLKHETLLDKITKLNEVNLYHPGVPDSIHNRLKVDIEVYIKNGKSKRLGASPKKNNNGKYISALEKGKIMVMDTTRFRPSGPNRNKPVSLIFVIPSDTDSVLQNVVVQMNEHFSPTSTNINILPNNEGMEIIYHFKNGFPRQSAGHPHHVEMIHVIGHLCDPGDPSCGDDQ